MVLRSWSLPVALALVSSTALLGQGASSPSGEEARFEALVHAYQVDSQPGGGRSAGRMGLAVDPGPTGTPDQAQARADRAARFARDLAAIHTEQLTHDQWIVYGLTRYNAEMEAENTGALFWLPTIITPYASPLRALTTPFVFAPLKTAADEEAYLAGLQAVPATLAAYRTRLQAQVDHGIGMPADELRLVLPFVRSFAGAPPESPFSMKAARLGAFKPADQAAFQVKVDDAIKRQVNPAVEQLAAFLEGPYRDRTRGVQTVGLAQYPNGAAYYQHLIHLYTGLDLTPQQIHDMGQKEVLRLNGELDQIRQSVAFAGSLDDFKTFLRTDKRFYPKTSEEIGQRMMTAIHLIEPKMSAFFSEMPKAPYGVRRLAPELEPSMTYGYYSLPTAADPEGYYNFNGLHPEERSMTMVSAIIFHELLPGHHYQLAIRDENPHLTGLRHTAMFTAYTEGWGEYASDLAGEMGGYPDPYARAGRLGMDLFVSTRLVIDTGMNALGWSRERARAFMKANTFESDSEIDTETLRYSVDYPGQALAYKLGSLKIHEMRDRLKAARGAAFDIREFHRYLLDAGEMPLGMFQQHFTCLISGEQHHPSGR
jgi:uncharacterized protein (DUF885 family)